MSFSPDWFSIQKEIDESIQMIIRKIQENPFQRLHPLTLKLNYPN